MIVFLDANVVVYLVESMPPWGPKVAARITALRAGGDRFGVSDLVRMECLVGPLKAGDATRVNDFTTFFSLADVQVLAINPAVCDRAARIRAAYSFQPLDSLHLAAAVEHGCGLFLTNDAPLTRFPDILVELLT